MMPKKKRRTTTTALAGVATVLGGLAVCAYMRQQQEIARLEHLRPAVALLVAEDEITRETLQQARAVLADKGTSS